MEQTLETVSKVVWDYGPYAIFLLFALWVAPKQTKVFLDCRRQDAVKFWLCGGVAAACWLIVGGTLLYVLYEWTPRKVYVGNLGRHGESVQFYSVRSKVFLTYQPTHPFRNLDWQYAVVVDRSSEADEEYQFAYAWGPEPESVTYYSLRRSELASRTFNFQPDPKDRTRLLYDHDRNPATEPIPYPKSAALPQTGPRLAGGFLAAWAQPETKVTDEATAKALVDALDSSNRYFQIQAQGQLRALPPPDLQNLLGRTDLPPVSREQIQRELQRR